MKLSRLLAPLLAIAVAGLAMAAPVVDQKKLKMRIAVAPLDWTDRDYISDWRIPVEFRNAIYEKLVKKLVDTNRFVVLEREAMEAMLTEKAIKEDNTGQSQKGKIVPAQALVKGKVTDFSLDNKGAGGGVSVGPIRVGASGGQAKMTINVRLFDVDTSEVLFSEDASGVALAGGFSIGANIGSAFTDFGAYEKSPLGKATTTAIDKAVEKILAKMDKTPWQAMVADFDGSSKEVTINAGSDLGVSEGDLFEVHRVMRVIKDPETGAVLGKRTSKVGSIKIIQVDKKFAIGQLVDGTEFQPGDIVREIKLR
ncbi:MAG TPA: CsgG/HfaB family protein [Fimbriimonadaceae bacterium]|nr:CsgG/HfaB family protein [Fimbriimonadaceae bacterium]